MGRETDFRLLFESTPGLYLVLSPNLSIVGVSNAYLRATMTKREEILGRGIFEVFPDNPDDAAPTGTANLRASLARVLTERRADAMAVQKYDIRLPAAEGGGFTERYWSPLNSPVLDTSGQVQYIIHQVEDVTEFVRLKQQHMEQDRIAEELRTRAGRMDAEIHRRAQQIQEANKSLRALQQELESRVATRTSELERSNQELQREMAEHKETAAALARSEEQLRQAQKMEAIGRLAGGIAHDFNNLLSVILSYSEFMLEGMKPDAPMYSDLAEIKAAGERAAALTRQMLAFSRQQVLEPKVLDLNELLTNLSKMLRRVLGEHIEYKFAPGPQLRQVKADPGQLEQVIMNLVVNARDAMPAGGKLTIETANVEIDKAYVRDHVGAKDGPHVMLAVSDTGTGMDKATQARIFEPFFTTKEMGKGTGLGLSTVFGIVKQSGGSIWVYSEVGIGSTFKVFLPRAQGTRDRIAALKPTIKVAAGNETILLVEDDAQVRAVASRMLNRAAYTVIEAASPAEALAVCQRDPTRIHLLLTDVVLPKMNGRELASRVTALRPNVKVLFMSGYTNDAVLQHGVVDSGMAFVQKPLTPEALRRRVREVLDGQAVNA